MSFNWSCLLNFSLLAIYLVSPLFYTICTLIMSTNYMLDIFIYIQPKNLSTELGMTTTYYVYDNIVWVWQSHGGVPPRGVPLSPLSPYVTPVPLSLLQTFQEHDVIHNTCSKLSQCSQHASACAYAIYTNVNISMRGSKKLSTKRSAYNIISRDIPRLPPLWILSSLSAHTLSSDVSLSTSIVVQVK